MWNLTKTFGLMVALTLLLVLVGEIWGGSQGMLLMVGVSGLLNLGAFFFSDKIVLRTSGAQPVDDPRLAWLHDDLQELSQKAGIPTPRLYWVPHESSPNAFATGRSPSKGVVAVTAGLVNRLSRREVKGVLAHELGHIKHRDTLTSAVAATMAGAVAYAARMMLWGRSRNKNPILLIVLAVAAPGAAMLLRMMVSRTREYAADARAARLTGDPEGLALALERLQSGVSANPQHTGSDATHYIVNGFSGGGVMSRMFSTHPPIEERAKRLRAMKL
ncbi:MAG: M48 family metalloprotease [Myxococcota bacterium]|nr:M48 family metalloprotease [Myxococcota bacterium]